MGGHVGGWAGAGCLSLQEARLQGWPEPVLGLGWSALEPGRAVSGWGWLAGPELPGLSAGCCGQILHCLGPICHGTGLGTYALPLTLGLWGPHCGPRTTLEPHPDLMEPQCDWTWGPWKRGGTGGPETNQMAKVAQTLLEQDFHPNR